MSFLIKIVARLQLKPIFIQKKAPALVFSLLLSEIFNKFLNFEKRALLQET